MKINTSHPGSTSATVLAMSVLAAFCVMLAGPASAAASASIDGALSGLVTDVPGCPPGPMICESAIDTGVVTHLGRAVLDKQFVVHFTNLTCSDGAALTTYTEAATLA